MKVSTLMYEITNEGYYLCEAKVINCDHHDVVYETNPSICVSQTLNLLGEPVPALMVVYYDKDLVEASKEGNELVNLLYNMNHAIMINNFIITAYYYLTDNMQESILLAEKLNKKLRIGNNLAKELKNE